MIVTKAVYPPTRIGLLRYHTINLHWTVVVKYLIITV